jgi:anti-sigma factor RsiW
MMVRDAADLMCKEVVELVTEYLGVAMTAEDRARFEQHLFTCPPCTAHLAQVRATVGLARALRDPPGEKADAALLDLFRRWRGR